MLVSDLLYKKLIAIIWWRQRCPHHSVIIKISTFGTINLSKTTFDKFFQFGNRRRLCCPCNSGLRYSQTSSLVLLEVGSPPWAASTCLSGRYYRKATQGQMKNLASKPFLWFSCLELRNQMYYQLWFISLGTMVQMFY